MTSGGASARQHLEERLQFLRKPSLAAKVASRLAKMVVKRWPRGNPAAIVSQCRKFLGLASIFSGLHTGGTLITAVKEKQVRGEWIGPNVGSLPDKAILYLHGGGYVSCSPITHRAITCSLARMASCRVFALDYHLAPEHPFPSAVDDVETAYQWLLRQGIKPHDISFAGDSAGGGLVVATLIRLREKQMQMPACGVCLSPWLDLTGTCEYRNAESCAMFRSTDVSAFASLYLGESAADLPEASPIFADLNGLPPLLIQASSTELLLDDAARLQEKASACGINSTLSIYPGLPHVWQVFVGLIPESREALLEAAEFIRGHQSNAQPSL